MRHNGLFYEVLKKNKELFSCMARCCQCDELNVRKVCELIVRTPLVCYNYSLFQSAIFAIGNSIYHSDQLYAYVEEILPILVNLLNDPLAKTRIHAAGKFY